VDSASKQASPMASQKEVVDALKKPDAYDEETGQIDLCQTHISFVFLTDKFVYKVKKAVNFGFLDFSTLDKRQFFCEKELELNRRLCPDMYLEVVPINKSNIIKVKGEGETVEYAVKMKRLPQDSIMTILLDENKVDNKLMDKIAKIVADFHEKAVTNWRISEFGSVSAIRVNWKENYDQTEEYIGKTLTLKEFKLIRDKVEEFIDASKTLFDKRIANARIRDCHGDIHTGNIFVTKKVYIFDAVEFNERFRYADVASDVAFLAMDLEFRKRRDLSEFFVKKYIKYSGDEELAKLLAFYKCYRAYVRGKVVGFRLNDPNIGRSEKDEALKEANAYFKLAVEYAQTL
jgi:aminoglycoside phosphotransferase family enzyme